MNIFRQLFGNKRKVDYREYIQSPAWRTKANEAKRQAGYKCQVCYASSAVIRIDTHHRTYERLGDELPSDLIVLCADCHKIFHDNRKVNDYGKLPESEYLRIAEQEFDQIVSDWAEENGY